MSAFGRAGHEAVNAFAVEGEYLFRHYFEEDAVFAELGEYYREYDYRFEVPAERFDAVAAFLERNGYALVEQEPEPFVVLKRKYTDHPDVLFDSAVLQRDLGNFNAFLLADRDAVERAVDAGARRLTDTDMSLPL